MLPCLIFDVRMGHPIYYLVICTLPLFHGFLFIPQLFGYAGTKTTSQRLDIEHAVPTTFFLGHRFSMSSPQCCSASSLLWHWAIVRTAHQSIFDLSVMGNSLLCSHDYAWHSVHTHKLNHIYRGTVTFSLRLLQDSIWTSLASWSDMCPQNFQVIGTVWSY